MFEEDPLYRGYSDLSRVPTMQKWELYRLRTWTADIVSRPHLHRKGMSDYYDDLLDAIDDEIFRRKFQPRT